MIQLIDPGIERYCTQKSTLPSKVCAEILRYTKAHVPFSQMLIGELEASFLGFLVSVISAKRVLEIGCFTGYSALAMAERLPKNGEVITLDMNAETTAVAKRFWAKSPHGRKIHLMLGEAKVSLQKIRGRFDFVFIDADKINYRHYFDYAIRHLAPKGLIAVDNCLWGGEVLKSKTTDADTRALRSFNDYIKRRADLEAVLVPIRDGVFLIRKIKS